MTDFYVIQHIPTGQLLAAPRGRRGRGGTHIEFGDPGQPRLFSSEHAARRALSWWLQGAVEVTVTSSRSGSFLGVDDDVDEEWKTHPRPERRAEDVRVAKARLEVLL